MYAFCRRFPDGAFAAQLREWIGELEAMLAAASEVTGFGWRNCPAIDPVGWYGGNSGVSYRPAMNSTTCPDKQYPHTTAGTRPVGQNLPNAFGLHDVIGNMAEWCQDTFGRYAAASMDGRAVEESGQIRRVFRGGAWSNGSASCRSANRGALRQGNSVDYIGLRPARSVD